MRLRLVVGFVATAATMLTPVVFTATSTAAPFEDFAVSDDGPYTRHDGGTDQAIAGQRFRSGVDHDFPRNGIADHRA